WQINNKQGEQRVNILEIGFGTGLNCLLTIEDALINADFDYYYTGIEKFPLNKIEYSSLNHSALICEKTDNIYVKSEVINASISV
ncbi:MAG: hypothetical protein K2X53_04665, partial [Alphaproteobacteria bacterium]|nr:hypothetical protein [Alphaproteobacteria bacterium]